MSKARLPERANHATLADFLHANNFPANFPNDGQYHRFSRKGGADLNAFYCGKEIRFGDRTVTRVLIGEWGTKLYALWESDTASLAPEEQAEFARQAEAMALAAAAEKARRQEEVAQAAQAKWGNAIERGTTPYLDRKGLKALYGAKIDPDYTDTLLVPMIDTQGKLWGLQRILPTKLPDSGIDKLFPKGGRISGNFHLIGDISESTETVYLCEGFATGASISSAVGSAPVVCAFNSGNLGHVSRALRAAYPNTRQVVCGDDDRWTVDPDGNPWNPGREAARDACADTADAAVFPIFTDAELTKRPTDFNDLALLQNGPERVVRAITNPPPPAPDAPAPSEAPRGGDRGPSKSEKKRASENQLAGMLHADTQGKLVRQDKELFGYTGTHWKELDSVAIDRLKSRINSFAGNKLGSSDVDAAYRTFFRDVRAVPEGLSLYGPRPDRANFLNGTLHLSFRPKTPAELSADPATAYVFTHDFRPHDPADFCTTVLPFEYRPRGELPENREFEEMLSRIWPDADPDAPGKRALYKELLGASLLPIFPKIFFFVGAPRSGKSTLLALVRKLLGDANISSVDPSRWSKEFQLEPMINKLGNVHEDISTTKTVDDSIMKSIIDRLPLGVNRKGRSVVQAKLPGLHAFGCNDMPRSLEGGSGAYDRRAIVIRTETPQAGQGGGGSFSEWIWGRGPEGILKAALEGLDRLLANGGNYTVPDSSREELREWSRESDAVAQFLEAVEHKEVVAFQSIISVGESLEITRPKLYHAFNEWGANTLGTHWVMSDRAFYKRMRQDTRFREHKRHGVRLWLGIGPVETV